MRIKKINEIEKFDFKASSDSFRRKSELRRNIKIDPYKQDTYTFEALVSFEGFTPTTIEGQLLISKEVDVTSDYLEKRVKKRLSVFHNIISYEIIEIKKSGISVYP